MRRLFGLPGIPTLEQIFHAVVSQLERLISMGGAVPLAVGTVLAYLLLVGCRRVTTA